jgi:multisubunit Na+/H+ antiporter MnhG subunit
MKASHTNRNRLSRLTTLALFGGPVTVLALIVAASIISSGWILLAAVAALLLSPVIGILSAVFASRMSRRISNEHFPYRLEKGLTHDYRPRCRCLPAGQG